VALALAQGSSHPLAQALAKGALGLGVRPAQVTEVREVPGHGIEGVWQETRVRLGRADWVGRRPDRSRRRRCGSAATLP
jgi:Cu2+-exporting ATPase